MNKRAHRPIGKHRGSNDGDHKEVLVGIAKSLEQLSAEGGQIHEAVFDCLLSYAY